MKMNEFTIKFNDLIMVVPFALIDFSTTCRFAEIGDCDNVTTLILGMCRWMDDEPFI